VFSSLKQTGRKSNCRKTYPGIDYLHIGTPEFRNWTGQAENAYKRLVSRYQLADLATYEQLVEKARS